MNRKQFAQVYREAAKAVEEGSENYSCCAVLNKLKDCGGPLDSFSYITTRDYRALFAPTTERPIIMFWLRDSMRIDEYRDWRVLALCFAAAMIETGDLEVPVE